MPKRHWYMEFVARDWLTDPAVSLLKESTRGIWMDALCCMFLQDGCGQLVGTHVDLARLCRTAPNAMKAAIDDLMERNACDVNERNGIVTLTNRRMRRLWTDRKSARDRKKRSRDRSDDGDVTPDVTGDVTDKSQRSYPNSHPNPKTSASAEVPPRPQRGKDCALPEVPDSLNTPAFLTAWAQWQEHRRQIRKKLTPLSVSQQLKQLESWGEERAIEAIAFTIRMGWTGLREDEARANGNGHAITAREARSREMHRFIDEEIHGGDDHA